MITFSKWRELLERMRSLQILESDLEESFIIGSGHGGQKLQKTASCVSLLHRPTGIRIKCHATRSRSDNRYHARRNLCEKIDEQIHQEKSLKQQAIEKIRRQKRTRSRKAKAKIRQLKIEKSAIKQNRKPPEVD